MCGKVRTLQYNNVFSFYIAFHWRLSVGIHKSPTVFFLINVNGFQRAINGTSENGDGKDIYSSD